MSENWQALCVTQVRAEMASIGLTPVGSATLIENFDSLVLGRGSRKLLAAISDADVRELARDFLINQFFRCDVFTCPGRRMKENERRDRLCASTFALARPRRAIKYTMASPAGRLKFSNPAARGIVSALSAGPASLAEIIAKSALPGQDVLANLLVLCAAGAVWPVEQRRTSVSALNEAIRRHLGGPDELLYLALPCGTALAVDDVLLRLLRGGRQAGVGKHGDWQEFLCSHGLPKHVRHARGGQRSNRHDSGAHHT
jgi:hypothetical protein